MIIVNPYSSHTGGRVADENDVILDMLDDNIRNISAAHFKSVPFQGRKTLNICVDKLFISHSNVNTLAISTGSIAIWASFLTLVTCNTFLLS